MKENHLKVKSGHIEISDKGVIFVYWKFLLPNLKDYKERFGWQYIKFYNKAVDKYRASRRKVEVSNVTKKSKDWYYNVIGTDCKNTDWALGKGIAINNQPCEAEVENNKATITNIK